MPNSQDENKPKTTWIVQLTPEQAEDVQKAYEASSKNFYKEIAERMSKLQPDDIAELLAKGTPKPPNKHEWASKVFMAGFSKTIS